MRIASLVPHATELLFALGAGQEVIAVTHECDHPAEARNRRRVTRDALPAGLDPGEIDLAVRERTLEGRSIYELDEPALRELRPQLIVTQALCSVCAVAHEDVVELARTMPGDPRVLSLDPRTLGETFEDARRLAATLAVPERGERLVADAQARLARMRACVASGPRPRVVALEWLDPVYIGGHWVPQMIELAGGLDPLGRPGEPSRTATWGEVAAAEPEIVVVMPCGYGARAAHEQALAAAGSLAGLGAKRIVAVDASAYFSRPGPRLIDGVELLAQILHPERFPDGSPRSDDAVMVELEASPGR